MRVLFKNKNGIGNLIEQRSVFVFALAQGFFGFFAFRNVCINDYQLLQFIILIPNGGQS